MDDYKIWIYIIIGVVYVLSRLRKKSEPSSPDGKHDSPEPDYRSEPRQTQEPQRQLTFEELLREITSSKEPEEYSPPAPVTPPVSQQTLARKKEYVDYDDDLKEEEQDLEDVEYDYRKKDPLYSTYEQAKKDAFNRPSLEETMKVEDTVVKFSKFKVFEEVRKRNLLEEYTRDLQDPEGLKKALVLNEILNRRF
jgi:hypothetical protein